MGIHDEDVARVREATDIVAVIGEYVQLKRVGRRWQGLCPFHAEKTPSFSVNAEMGVYHCFGCKASGDAITFLREVEHADFVEAVERLAGRAGIVLRYTAPGEGADRQKRGKLTDALEQAVEWYHQRLLTAADAGPARGYLRHRGYDGDVVRQYKMGWAPDDWDALAADLGVGTDKGMAAQVFSDAGLGFRNKGGRIQDSFRARLLFPIFDPSGKPVGFGGRVLPGGDGPKYKNSVDNAVYRKSRVLYGLNWAKQDIVNAGEVIVCEGYTDVIGFAQAGIARAVATCGTALTEDHVRVLRRFAPRIVLAFDADSAGQTAAERFSQWEHAFELEVAVADLPPGADPGDLAQSDPERLAAAVSDAVDFMDFRINRVLGEADLSTVKGQVRAGERAARLVAEHPNPEIRDKYLVEVADRCSVNADHLRKVAAEALRRGPRRAPRPAAEGAPHPADTVHESSGDRGGYSEFESDEVNGSPPPNNVERQVLWLAANEPDGVWPEIGPELFHHPLYRGVFEALLEYPDMDTLLAEADPRVTELMRELVVDEDEELRTSRHRQDVVMAILLYEEAQRELAYLERQARTGSADEELLRRVARLKTAMDQLRESEWEPEQARALLELLRPSP
ncbi:MAG: DNA primase [Acidimicrobiia bacterium]|nr:DNA primase [Acidimicrobiia bacterium]MYB10274.1 DNA primase [Acidimicrobiia bacterium]MYG58592.1 DNA primase [Acidimicrobiia bacterium]MYG71993.1 DNA primase [Acidimicrobiia bacterium]MYH94888.1 DNA primase [Acidimicrobiia bacterium]